MICTNQCLPSINLNQNFHKLTKRTSHTLKFYQHQVNRCYLISSQLHYHNSSGRPYGHYNLQYSSNGQLIVKVIIKTPVRVHLIRNLDDCEGRNLMLILVTPPIYASNEELTMLKKRDKASDTYKSILRS